ncbi:MAG: hypothetical protein M9936_24875 [Caldilinea sp.]|nr:hypothetical protein [Caldilinea sp.]
MSGCQLHLEADCAVERRRVAGDPVFDGNLGLCGALAVGRGQVGFDQIRQLRRQRGKAVAERGAHFLPHGDQGGDIRLIHDLLLSWAGLWAFRNRSVLTPAWE